MVRGVPRVLMGAHGERIHTHAPTQGRPGCPLAIRAWWTVSKCRLKPGLDAVSAPSVMGWNTREDSARRCLCGIGGRSFRAPGGDHAVVYSDQAAEAKATYQDAPTADH